MEHRVLLVDRDPAILETLTAALAGGPYKVRIASNREQATVLLEQGDVDILVVGEPAPGVAACALIRWTAETRPEVVRLVMAGDAAIPAVIREVHDGDVFQFLPRPCAGPLAVAAIHRAAEHLAILAENARLRAADPAHLKDATHLKDAAPGPAGPCPAPPASAPAVDLLAFPSVDVLMDARVLIVDDTPLNVAVLSDELRERGCKVLTGASGEEALAIVAAEHPDVILLDVMMPGMDGLEVCRRLKADPTTRAIPVIMVTCLTGKQSIISGLDAGADDYITKPFAPGVLMARLRAALRVKRAYDQIARGNRQLRAEIDHRKRTEQLLRQNEHALLEQTASIKEAKERMERLKEEAEAATQAKSRFLANTSHEIRSPLTAILGYTDLLCEPELSDAERLAHVQTIRRNGEILLQLINDILDLSKVEAGRMTLEQVNCPLWRILGEVETLMRPRAAAKNLKLELESRFPLPKTIRTDPVRLRQILLNLIGNAVKFTDAGMVRVEIGLDQSADGPPTLRFDVIDTGIGMSPEEMARLFRPFTQADSTTTRRFGGTGLGLTISKRLAEALGGDVAVRSNPGRGSTFTLSIDPGPLDGVAMLEGPPEAPAKQSPRRPADNPDGPLSGRVLLAEDGVDNQRLITILLTKVGIEVDVAQNGRVALEMVAAANNENRPYDLILMDMQMPELDGYTATRMLRQLGWDGPIVALTASAMAQEQDKCLAAGCNDFQAKPIDMPAFQNMLVRYLEPAAIPAAVP